MKTSVKKRESVKRWRRAHPEKVRVWTRIQNLWRLHKITLDRFDRILEYQEGRCGACKSQNPGGKGNWHVDHDHKTGAVRGLLCHSCNLGLGHFHDDQERLEAAKAYLRDPPALKVP